MNTGYLLPQDSLLPPVPVFGQLWQYTRCSYMLCPAGDMDLAAVPSAPLMEASTLQYNWKSSTELCIEHTVEHFI